MHNWHSSSSKNAYDTATNRAAAFFLLVVDTGLLAILFVAPWFFGGRDPLGRSIFIFLASGIGIAWLARQTLLYQHSQWTRTSANLLLLAALAIVSLQLVPFSPTWLHWLAPRNMSLLPLWSDESGALFQLGQWQTLSLTPSATKLALATLIAYALLFITVVGRLRTLDDIRELLQKIVIAALLMGSFGLVQYFFTNGRFFWFYEYPYTDTFTRVKGSFTCRNHFAHFLVLGAGPLLAWLALRLQIPSVSSSHRVPTRSTLSLGNMALKLGLALLVFAVFLSLSRGGAIALTVVFCIALSLYYRSGLISGRYLYGMLTLGVVVLGLLSLHGYENVARRLDDFSTASLEDLDHRSSRRKIWAANLRAIQQGHLLGAGAGSHEQIYPVYLSESVNLRYTHAENSYLQVGSENGWLGLALLAIGLLLASLWCWRAIRYATNSTHRILSIGVAASLGASVVHAVIDFVWFIPACMSVTVILLACLLRLAQQSPSESPQSSCQVSFSQARWIALTSVAVCAALWAMTTASGPGLASMNWNRYLLASQESKHLQYQQLAGSQPSSRTPNQETPLTETMIYHLKNTLAHHPNFAEAHLRLANRYLEKFEKLMLHSDNMMTIDQIRDAALSSKFPSGKALQKWLQTAFGPKSRLLYQAHYHALRAVELSPLQGQAYLHLANLCFLEGRQRDAIDTYFNQSLCVRRYQGKVLFEVGRQYLVAGRFEEAFQFLRNAYQHAGLHQLKTVHIAAGGLPVSTFIEIFKPDWQTLGYVWKQYLDTGTPESLAFLVNHATQEADKECLRCKTEKATKILLALSQMQIHIQDFNSAVASLQRAHQLAPNHYLVRRMLGRTLLRTQQFQQAKNHLHWCLARKPDDDTLQEELLLAAKNRLSHAAGNSGGQYLTK